MKNVKLDEIKAGMVLAREVKGRFGRGLLLAGNVVTEKHLKIFKSWGITEIIVEKNEAGSEERLEKPAETPAHYDRIERRMKGLFKFNDLKHPAVRELFQIALNRNLDLHPPQEP